MMSKKDIDTFLQNARWASVDQLDLLIDSLHSERERKIVAKIKTEEFPSFSSDEKEMIQLGQIGKAVRRYRDRNKVPQYQAELMVKYRNK